MPFSVARVPSIQVGLLKAAAEARGFPVRTLHANLELAARIGVTYYEAISGHSGCLLGDWLFSLEAFQEAAPDPGSELVDHFAKELAKLGYPPGELRDRLLRTRLHEIPEYLDALIANGRWEDVGVVGFTSTFNQNTASFALARRLKERFPSILTVFGGANFEGDMGREYLRTVDAVDLVVTGDGDTAFPLLLQALASGRDPGTVPGVTARQSSTSTSNAVPTTPPAPRPTTPPPAPQPPPESSAPWPTPVVHDLDASPMPDYRDYFEHARRLGIIPSAGGDHTWIPVETARGCWWGARQHCYFCGLNGTSMTYRSKSPERTFEEITTLARLHRVGRIGTVDRIVEPRYLRTLFPRLVADGVNLEIAYEIRSDLRRGQLKLLSEAGVTTVQAGLESLSSNVLRLMRKGVRAAQNVNVLRWARHYGIDVAWNILFGFPGETERDYAEQEAAVAHLLHLQPPQGVNRILMTRYSPFYDDSARHRIRYRRPERAYRYVYPDHIDLDKIAHTFDYELTDALPASAYAGLKTATTQWSRAWAAGRRPALRHRSAPHFVQIYDGRAEGREGTYTFEGVLADIYLAGIERPVSATAIRRRLDTPLRTEAISEALAEFQRRGLVFLDGRLAVALTLPAASIN